MIKQNSNKLRMHPSAGGKSLKRYKLMYRVLGVDSNTYQNIPWCMQACQKLDSWWNWAGLWHPNARRKKVYFKTEKEIFLDWLRGEQQGKKYTNYGCKELQLPNFIPCRHNQCPRFHFHPCLCPSVQFLSHWSRILHLPFLALYNAAFVERPPW